MSGSIEAYYETTTATGKARVGKDADMSDTVSGSIRRPFHQEKDKHRANQVRHDRPHTGGPPPRVQTKNRHPLHISSSKDPGKTMLVRYVTVKG